MLRDELQFDFNHGNIMDQVNILSDKVQACFKSVAEDLRFNQVYEKENGTGDGDAYFQTADKYYETRCALPWDSPSTRYLVLSLKLCCARYSAKNMSALS
jgi:hypothetical protein